MPETQPVTCKGLVAQPHTALFESIVSRMKSVPEITKVAGYSEDESLMVVLVVNSDDEAIWDRIADIEYDVEHESPEEPILIFRECDLFGESSPEFMDLPEELAAEIAAAS